MYRCIIFYPNKINAHKGALGFNQKYFSLSTQRPFRTADILICHSRKNTGGINEDSFPLAFSGSLNNETACTKTGCALTRLRLLLSTCAFQLLYKNVAITVY